MVARGTKGRINDPKRALLAAERRTRALELRRTGMGFQAIAAALGFRSTSSAHDAYRQALRLALREAGSEECRQLELERLDRLQQDWWPLALRRTRTVKDKDGNTTTVEVPPSYRAVDRVLKIIKARIDLLGLNAPTKHQVETPPPPLIDRERQQAMLRSEKGYDLLREIERLSAELDREIDRVMAADGDAPGTDQDAI